jgi:DMSO/TMAO reductase YedYZ molybdopterin-dependent catalytic subunit
MKTRKIQSFFLVVLVLFALGNSIFSITADEEEEIPITPIEDFFTTAIDYFDIDSEEYRLVVFGEVYNPLNLSLDEIKSLPVASEIVRLTCIAYKYGANDMTGVANWTGVKLSTILDLAQINTKKAKDISLHTPDLSPWAFSTSLDIKEAFWDDVLLAYEMNGEPLPRDHGFPIRLVCPRFYGYKWIKWLAYINVTTEDYRGTYESNGYDDSPYVDVDLPIYYALSGITLDNQDQSFFPWNGLEVFLAVIAVGILVILGVRYLRHK